MSFDVPPLATSLAASSVDRPGRGCEGSAESFGDAARAGGAPPIPVEVWDQIDAAARLAEDLHAQGRGVRFDVHKLGVVVAELVDDNLGLLRPLPLGDVVDVDRLAHELSKDRT
jgi:hypothetical protein